MPRGPKEKAWENTQQNMPKNAILTKGPNEKNKEEKQDAPRETNIKETIPIVNRRRERGKQLRNPRAALKGERGKATTETSRICQ